MASSASSTTNGMVLITHVHPAGNTMGMGQVGQVVSSTLGKFRKGHPKALGTVQIMIGVMFFLIGISMTVGGGLTRGLGVYSGIFVWGTAFYIIAGSLTIAADKNLNKCLVNASLGMNVVATVTACTGVILHSFDAAGIMYHCYDQHCQQYYWYMQVFIIGNHFPQGGAVAPQTPNYEAMRYPGPEAAHPNNLSPQYSPATIP